MKFKAFVLFLGTTLVGFILPESSLQAGGISSGPTPSQGLSLALNLDQSVLDWENQSSGIPTVSVTPGSEVELSLDLSSLTLGNLATPVDSFSFNFAFSDLVDPTFTSDLPGGWTYTLTSTSFTAQNMSGSDLSIGQDNYMGELSFTVNPSAPVGSSFYLDPIASISNVSSSDASGNAIPSEAADVTEIQMNVVPEPSTLQLLTVCVLGAGCWVLMARQFWPAKFRLRYM
jgi:hypothetical protein